MGVDLQILIIPLFYLGFIGGVIGLLVYTARRLERVTKAFEMMAQTHQLSGTLTRLDILRSGSVSEVPE